MFWAIGVVTQRPNIDRESYQNHNGTHNEVEDEKIREPLGPLANQGVDFFGPRVGKPLTTDSQPLKKQATP